MGHNPPSRAASRSHAANLPRLLLRSLLLLLLLPLLPLLWLLWLLWLLRLLRLLRLRFVLPAAWAAALTPLAARPK